MSQAIIKHPSSNVKLSESLASRFHISGPQLIEVVKKQCLQKKGQVTDEELIQFLMVCHEYNLNPMMRHVHALFDAKGVMMPYVSVDGWVSIVNQHASFDGVEFEEHMDGGELVSITCSIHVKGRAHPTRVTEYLKECKLNTKPWIERPIRMLRHKALIQCARVAFGLGGIMDPEEAFDAVLNSGTPTAEPEQPKALGVSALKERIMRKAEPKSPPDAAPRVEQTVEAEGLADSGQGRPVFDDVPPDDEVNYDVADAVEGDMS